MYDRKWVNAIYYCVRARTSRTLTFYRLLRNIPQIPYEMLKAGGTHTLICLKTMCAVDGEFIFFLFCFFY